MQLLRYFITSEVLQPRIYLNLTSQKCYSFTLRREAKFILSPLTSQQENT